MSGRPRPEDGSALFRRLLPIAALVLLAAFYVVTSPVNRTEADDALWYAWDVETQPWPGLLNPHHMLFLPLERLIWMIGRSLGAGDRAYPVLIVAGAFTAAATVVVSWDTLVRRLDFAPARAGLSVGLLAFAYGFWRYAAEVEVYALALLWCAALVNLALAVRPSRAGFAALALLGATAPLVHILTAALAGVAAPIAIGVRRGCRAAAGYLVAAGSAGLALAVAGYLLAGQPDGGLVAFYMGGKTAEAVGGLNEAARHAVAAGQAVVSGNFLLTYPAFRDQIAAWFPYRMLADEIYAGEHAALAIRFLAPLSLAALLFAAGRFVLSGRAQLDHPGRRSALALALAWLFLHVGLGVLFSRAGNPETWLLSLFPTWLLIVCLLVSREGRNRTLVAIVAALLVHNLIGGLWVYDNPEGDRNRAKGGWLIQNTKTSDAILTADSPVFVRYLRYWAPATVIDLQSYDADGLARAWSEATEYPGSLLATDDVFRPPAYYRVLYPAGAGALGAFGRKVADEFESIVTNEFGGIWKRPRERQRRP